MSSALHNNFFFYCYLWLEVFFPNHWSPFSILFCFSAMSEFLKCGTWKLGYLATACVGIAVQLPSRVSPQSPRASQKFFLYLDPSSRWPYNFSWVDLRSRAFFIQPQPQTPVPARPGLSLHPWKPESWVTFDFKS